MSSSAPTIDEYALVSEVAKSPMGSLYAALDPTGSPVLLRMLAIPDGADVPRFLELAEQASGIVHPSVASVLECVQGDGCIGLVSPHMECEGLRQVQLLGGVRRMPPTVEAVLRISLDIIDALKAVLAEQLCHGGVSPDSVLLGTDGGVRLFDVVVSSAATKFESVGASAEMIAYSSPETIGGNKEATETSDVFSVGILLWELLTTRRLFIGSARAVGQKVLGAKIPRADSLKRKDGATIRPELADIVDKALQRDPTDRYATLDEFADALLALGEALPGRDELGAYVAELCARPLENRRDQLAHALKAKTRSSLPGAGAGRRVPRKVQRTMLGMAPPVLNKPTPKVGTEAKPAAPIRKRAPSIPRIDLHKPAFSTETPSAVTPQAPSVAASGVKKTGPAPLVPAERSGGHRTEEEQTVRMPQDALLAGLVAPAPKASVEKPAVTDGAAAAEANKTSVAVEKTPMPEPMPEPEPEPEQISFEETAALASAPDFAVPPPVLSGTIEIPVDVSEVPSAFPEAAPTGVQPSVEASDAAGVPSFEDRISHAPAPKRAFGRVYAPSDALPGGQAGAAAIPPGGGASSGPRGEGPPVIWIAAAVGSLMVFAAVWWASSDTTSIKTETTSTATAASADAPVAANEPELKVPEVPEPSVESAPSANTVGPDSPAPAMSAEVENEPAEVEPEAQPVKPVVVPQAPRPPRPVTRKAPKKRPKRKAKPKAAKKAFTPDDI
ncbi:MAG: protein kinase [Polyangiaceae bacterium]|nr:protein kinase [Polyangiaceae bacterium]